MSKTLAAVVVIALARTVSAQPDPEPPPAPAEPPVATSTEPEPTTELERKAPRPAPVTARPGHESGRLDAEDEDSAVRTVTRTILFIPRSLFEMAMAPVELGLWSVDRYHLPARAHDLFFNEEGTIGLYPTIAFASGFGFSIGARFVMRFWDTNQLRLFAGTGGQYRDKYQGTLKSVGLADDHVSFELDAKLERRPNDRFFGIGNADETTTLPAMPIDPLTDDTAFDTRYRNELARLALEVDIRPVSDFHIDLSGALAQRKRSNSDSGTTITDVYMPSSLIGFDDYDSLYGEGQLRWDTRGPYDDWQPTKLATTGSLAQVYFGRLGIQDEQGTWRYGADLQHFMRITRGPRAISVRLHGEGVTADTDELPFNELPALGGARLLRGYEWDRFRDRVAAVGTAEYQWGLSHNLYASLFTDVGRVYPSLSDLTFSDMRCGYGLAFEVHTQHHLLGRASVASSIDGGVFFNLYFEPVFDIDSRVERR